MNALASHIAVTAIGIAAGALAVTIYTGSGNAPEPAAGAQAEIDGAIEAFAAAARTEEAAASAERIAGREATLERDPGTPFLGNESGDVIIVEFADYTCVFCKAVHPRLRALVESDDGVKLVVKDFPILTDISRVAAKAALASQSQGGHAAFHNALMEASGQLSEERIFEIAESVGLDVAQLRADMSGPDISDQIIDNFNLARSLRVIGTPTFIVDGQLVTQPSSEIDFPELVVAARSD